MSDLLSALSPPLNFTVLWTLPPDGRWGSSSVGDGTAIGNGTGMSGIVGELNSKEADLSTGGLYMTSERQVKEEGTAILFICHLVAGKNYVLCLAVITNLLIAAASASTALVTVFLCGCC